MPTANDMYYKRDDVIRALAEYLMDEAQTEWAGTASEDIEDWEDLAEMILRDVPSVTGALMRAEAYAEGIKAEQERTTKKGNRIRADEGAEPKQGEWLFKEITDDYHITGQCSVCKERRRIDNFCANCGCDMRGGSANER